jgi:hypothetical protein
MIIDDLYKNNFSESGERPPGYNWDEMNRKLKRRLFFRFSPAKFNIYYLLLLISFSGFSSYSGYRSYKLQKEIRQKEMHYKTSIDSLKQVIDIVIPDTVRTEEKAESITVQQKKSDTTEPIQRNQVRHLKKTTIIKSTVIEETDTVKILN